MPFPRRAPRGAACGLSLVALVGACLLNARPAAAESDVLDPDLTAKRPLRTGPVNLLPEGVAARVNDDRVVATTWAGYDSARRAPLLTATVEARIVGRLVFLAGAGTTAQTAGTNGLRSQIGLRLQVLDQARQGVDAAAAVMLRQDQFTSEGGFYQAALALERRQGRLVLAVNLLYGQDGEGDDRQGEARAAGMVATGRGVLVGVDARYRHDLWSADPRGAGADRPVSELVAGPAASFTHGSWMVMAETGVSSVQIPARQTGVIALGGFSSCF